MMQININYIYLVLGNGKRSIFAWLMIQLLESSQMIPTWQLLCKYFLACTSEYFKAENCQACEQIMKIFKKVNND